MSERVYTLAEAARVRAFQSCASHGHDWNILQTMGGGPHALTCGTCGWSGRISMGEQPKPPEGAPPPCQTGSDGASRPERGQP